MPNYICNQNVDDKGRHEIHTSSCNHLPDFRNRLDIGFHSDCQSAIRYIKLENPSHEFDGCYYCCYACHKG